MSRLEPGSLPAGLRLAHSPLGGYSLGLLSEAALVGPAPVFGIELAVAAARAAGAALIETTVPANVDRSVNTHLEASGWIRSGCTIDVTPERYRPCFTKEGARQLLAKLDARLEPVAREDCPERAFVQHLLSVAMDRGLHAFERSRYPNARLREIVEQAAAAELARPGTRSLVCAGKTELLGHITIDLPGADGVARAVDAFVIPAAMGQGVAKLLTDAAFELHFGAARRVVGTVGATPGRSEEMILGELARSGWQRCADNWHRVLIPSLAEASA